MCGHTQQASIRRAHSIIKRQRSSAAAHTWRGSHRRGRTRTGRAPPHARDSNPCRAAVRRAHERVRRASNVDLLDSRGHSPCEQSESIRALHYGESEDPAKMAYSRMALVGRGPGAKPASSNSHAGAYHAGCRSASAQASAAAAVRAQQRTPCDQAVEDEELGEEGRHRTPGARTRAVRIQAM